MTASARDPAALNARGDLRAVAGDVLDAAAVERAVAGHDAVLCALGSSATRPGKVRSEGTLNILRAMESSGPRRLICQSTIGIGDSRALLPPLYRYMLVPLLLRATFAEHERQEAVVRSSELEWTVVRAGALTDGECTGRYRVIAAQQKPDHATVARFVERHQDALAGLFGSVLGLCAQAGLVSVGVVAIDGTKLHA
ncbi:MAG: NAD(P)H-binding protein, partial [Actinobacteria bacterium]|nr:NAD(P)H-binding protein [Actinomycetota bacterium]